MHKTIAVRRSCINCDRPVSGVPSALHSLHLVATLFISVANYQTESLSLLVFSTGTQCWSEMAALGESLLFFSMELKTIV